jgi:7,8-dihydropterin-6-yl-methyl-4-(beta-D-ribofuranosyl)aminobenzene 5'-phosphate synthase
MLHTPPAPRAAPAGGIELADHAENGYLSKLLEKGILMGESKIGELDRLGITVVAEDSVLYESPFLGQHGISILIDAERKELRKKILVDVGQNSTALLNNMKLMNIHPAEIDAIIITHCHYDHTQGLATIVKEIGKREFSIIAHPSLFRLNFINNPYLRHVGVMQEDSREKIESAGGSLFLVSNPFLLMPGLTTTGEVKRQTDFEEVGISLLTVHEGQTEKDVMLDDISVIANVKDRGLVIVTGCSHAGIINIVRQCMEITGVQKLHGIIGGLHLIEAPDQRIRRTVEELRKMNPDWVSAGHCTGFKAQIELWNNFKEKFSPLHTGAKFEIVGKQ